MAIADHRRAAYAGKCGVGSELGVNRNMPSDIFLAVALRATRDRRSARGIFSGLISLCLALNISFTTEPIDRASLPRGHGTLYDGQCPGT
jgi:hypothetical protein